MNKLTISISRASELIGISRNTGHALAREDKFPCRVIRVGRTTLVPVNDLATLLGVSPDELLRSTKEAGANARCAPSSRD